MSCEPKQSGSRNTARGHPRGGEQNGEGSPFAERENDNDLHAAIATLVVSRSAISGGQRFIFVGRPQQIMALAARHALPAMYFLPEFAAVGDNELLQ